MGIKEKVKKKIKKFKEKADHQLSKRSQAYYSVKAIKKATSDLKDVKRKYRKCKKELKECPKGSERYAILSLKVELLDKFLDCVKDRDKKKMDMVAKEYDHHFPDDF